MSFSSRKKGACFTLKGHFLLRKKGTFRLEKRALLGCWKLGGGAQSAPPPGSAALEYRLYTNSEIKILICTKVTHVHFVRDGAKHSQYSDQQGYTVEYVFPPPPEAKLFIPLQFRTPVRTHLHTANQRPRVLICIQPIHRG